MVTSGSVYSVSFIAYGDVHSKCYSDPLSLLDLILYFLLPALHSPSDLLLCFPPPATSAVLPTPSLICCVLPRTEAAHATYGTHAWVGHPCIMLWCSSPPTHIRNPVQTSPYYSNVNNSQLESRISPRSIL